MRKFSFLIMCLLLTALLRSQNSLYLWTNASVFIGAGTPLAVDSNYTAVIVLADNSTISKNL